MSCRVGGATVATQACIYVWPEALGLQLRTLGCFLLLVAMRFLNLAVPIIYKRLVDTLAAASGSQGGRGGGGGGEGPRPTLGDLAVPWVLLYLAAVFFQGGAGGGVVGFINNMRSYLWIPVSQDAFRQGEEGAGGARGTGWVGTGLGGGEAGGARGRG